MISSGSLRIESRGSDWQLVGTGIDGFGLINEFLGYLADRAYSPRTVRAYAFDLLAFARWLLEQRIALEEITTEVLLRFLTACRTALLPDRHGDNVFSIRDGRNSGYAATTINRRLAAISAGARLDGLPRVSGLACSATSPSPGRGQACGYASRDVCHADSNRAKPRHS